jgi:molybdate transport system ATP-binding protein
MNANEGASADGLTVAFRHRLGETDFDIAFSAPPRGLVALFGPSGSGKSTAALVAAGLLRPESGRVVVRGTVLTDTEHGIFVPPERRRVGIVFQDSRLFPHMRVEANLRYGARRNPPGPVRLDEVVALLGLSPLLSRRPHTLSGGERQRVAIGRALLAQPMALVLDEPLASLDAARKAEILPYLERLKAAMALPILYISHDLAEVVRLADTLALIEAGRIVASGSVEAIAARADLPLAARDDAGAVLDATVVAHHALRDLTEIAAGGRRLLLPTLVATPGSVVRVRIPAREVALATEPPRSISVHNIVPGIVGSITPNPARRSVLVEVRIDGSGLLARVTPDAIAALGLATGRPVFALVKSVAIEAIG